MVEYKETKSNKINQATYDLQHLNITGNVIPHNWFNHLKMDTGAPDYQSIILLSEIVYWYKPKEVFNEQGIQIGIGKKYDADTLQKSYEDLADKFGMTKRQVREAIIRLENRGLIKRNLEYIKSKGMPISNVLFIDLFVDKLKEITIVSESVTGVCSNSSQGYPRSRQTYTKSTTKTTTKTKDIKDNVTIAPSASKVKYENEIKIVVDHYNQSMGTRKGYTEKTLVKDLTKIFKEGYTTDNVKDVLNYKIHEWINNTEMKKHLVPGTLFRFSNFEKYMDQLILANQPVNNQKKYQAPQQQAPSKVEFVKLEPDNNGFDGTNLSYEFMNRGIDNDTLIAYYKKQVEITGKGVFDGKREIPLKEWIEDFQMFNK